MIEPSGALIVKDVRPGDDGVYSCRAENLLGSVNATAKLTVQCKFFSVLFHVSVISANRAFFLIAVFCEIFKYWSGLPLVTIYNTIQFYFRSIHGYIHKQKLKPTRILLKNKKNILLSSITA